MNVLNKVRVNGKEYKIGSESQTQKNIYNSTLNGSEWLRIAKVDDIKKNSSGIFTVNCYGVNEDESLNVLTTSVFSISCGINAQGRFVSDVLPITQAPEIFSSSGGISGGEISSGEEFGSGEEPSSDVSSDEYSVVVANEVEVTSDEVSSDETSSDDPSSDIGSGDEMDSSTGSGGSRIKYGLSNIKLEYYKDDIYIY